MSNLFKTTQEGRHPQAFRAFLAITLLLCLGVQSVSAQTQTATNTSQTRLVVRDGLGLNGILNLCLLLRCSSATALGDPQGQLFMIQIPSLLAPVTSLLNISVLGLVTIETDQFVQTQGATAGAVPAYLTDKAPFTYYGTNVWRCYVFQPCKQLIRTVSSHTTFNTAGPGCYDADSDTGA